VKLKLSLCIAVLAVGLSAVVAVATPTAQAKKGGNYAFPVDGTLGGQAVGGTFNISKFQVVNGVLTAVGTYSSATQAATPASAAVTSINGTSLGGSGSNVAAPAQATATCDILDLVLGPLHLDLLGLVIDLNQVHLQITAEQGPGNLLGNLLCAVAGLLDNNPAGGGLSGLLQSIANLLNQILGQLRL
jgi:hypothetical protein